MFAAHGWHSISVPLWEDALGFPPTLLLLSRFKSLFNEDYLDHNGSWVMADSAFKLLSLWGFWGLEYGPDMSKLIPEQERIGFFLAFYTIADGGLMYFLPRQYAAM